ncbi:MAG: alpha/beta fold hydrolase [Thiothrix sp.]|nr:alpha/beta fold hydrolase [Thiothrix sp.]HPE59018.1 alpha/beta fold hydrolase [Thiolinea sp.]
MSTALQFLPVSPLHTLCHAEFGNPAGIPLVFLHGGPGSSAQAELASLFLPERYRLILFDQRGCGRSTPQGERVHNTLADLVQDIETLRQHLGIPRWVVYGGSWGATLALEYAKAHREQVLGLLLRGSFLGRTQDLNWFVAPDGVAQSFPQAYQLVQAQLQPAAGEHLYDALYRHLRGYEQDFPAALRAARAWDQWENAVMGFASSRTGTAAADPDLQRHFPVVASKLIYAHYCVHHCFLPPEGVLPGIEALQGIALEIIHGRQDQVCQPEAALTLQQRLPQAGLQLVEAGHGMHEAAIRAGIVVGLERLAERVAV